MEPIISPWTIYFINLLPSISQMLNTLAVACALISVIAIILRACCTDDSWETKEQHQRNAEFRDKCITCLKYSIPAGVIAIVINIFIPSRDTMIAMIVSSYITPDNLHGANEVIKANLQDYINMIVDGINKVK
ncbi:MAG: hypothetical protein JTJ30_12585 [Catenibacterium mitsuokai]|nr:hypothetical protein [Catenibacterium mitsuokai]MBN2932802.1 hypothetical protein [Catenibacterium mitsuokai]